MSENVIKEQRNIPLDWSTLRGQGMSLIELMNAESLLWTDYNISDSGITILETLCYGISDLVYRLNFPIVDLLTLQSTADSHEQFFLPEQVLPNGPLTVNDYRRLLIDKPGINNAWIHANKSSGLYIVFLDLSEGYRNISTIQTQALNSLNTQRNLAEKFGYLEVLEKVHIQVSLSLVLTDNADSSRVTKLVNQLCRDFFSVSVPKYTFAQLLEHQISVADILQGPLVKHGFVLSEDLNRNQAVFNESDEEHLAKPTFIFNLDCLKQHLSELAEIKQVQELSVQSEHKKYQPDKETNIEITGLVPEYAGVAVQLYQYGLSLGEQVLTAEDKPQVQVQSDIDFSFPRGQTRHLAAYTKLQQDFPAYYQVGEGQEFSGLSELEQHRVNQLNAYLDIFNQTLQQSFLQLSDVAEQLKIVKTAPTANTEKNLQLQNNLLDYLLSLFGESYMPVPVFNELPETPGEYYDTELISTQYLIAKQGYLNQVALLRGNRAQPEVLKQIIALQLSLEPKQVVLEENIQFRTLPIPYNKIPFAISAGGDQAFAQIPPLPIPDNSIPFLVTGPPGGNFFAVKILLPKQFVYPGYVQDILTKGDVLQQYVYQTLLQLIPAHIRFTLHILPERE